MEQRNPKKSALYYWIVAVIIIVLLNVFLFPAMTSGNTKEVSYNTFLNELEKKNIDKVQVNDSEIMFSLKNEEKKEGAETRLDDLLAEYGGVKTVYMTVRMEDLQLVDRLYAAGATFERVVPKEMSPIMSIVLSYVVPMLIFLLIWRIMMRQMSKGGGNVMSFGKSNAKIYVKAKTGKTFADVAGQEEAKESLTEIVDFLHNPSKYAEIGANLPKGALLVGPPGTGKTLLAQAVAGEANVPFFSISGSEFVEMFVGMGAAKVRDLFKQANEKAPCIVFIDEIDTIGKKRDGQGFSGNDEREQTLNQLLTEMDGFDGKRGVVILAATNRPESLDKALLRPGRFDRRIPVELPDLKGREAILAVHAKNVKTEPQVDYQQIARATSGASGAELANIINEAALRAVRCGRDRVTQQDLDESVDVILAGYKRKGMVVSKHERDVIAYHEVGHALVAALQKDSAPVHKITIIPRTSGALGYTMQVDEDEKFLMTREEAFNKIVTLTGGRAAEKIIFGSVTTGASNDIEQATRLARAMIARYGMSDEFGMVALETVTNKYLGGDATLACSEAMSAKVDEAVIGLVKAAYSEAEQILGANTAAMHRIAEYLIEKETISGEEFMSILGTVRSDNDDCGEDVNK